MTHEELDRTAMQLQKNCNFTIEENFPKWGRYAVNQMIERTMRDMAPDWDYLVTQGLGHYAPRVALTNYRGPVE